MSSPFHRDPKPDLDAAIGAIFLAGVALSIVGVAMLLMGIWVDWRWGVSGVVPLVFGVSLLRFAWRLA